MGAAALVTDREVTSRLRAYLNLESIGSSGTSVLFETGPGNGWLVAPWARRAPHPRGGSYAIEVYTRLPNDTDFSILKTRDVPGLNFAAVGDSYAYHTARDTPERLSRETVRTTGENVVSIATALQAADITTRTADTPVFFDIGGTVAVSYGTTVHWLISALALITGVIAWVRVSGDAVRTNGVLRWILTIAWGWLGGLFVAIAMAGATWLLRFAREVYHPWYARPGRLLLLLIVSGIAVGWGMARAGPLAAGAEPSCPASGADVERRAADMDRAGRGLPVVCTRRRVSVDRAAVQRRHPAVAGAAQQRPARSHRVARRALRLGNDVAARGQRVVALHRRHHGPAADRHAVLRLRGGAERRRSDGGSAFHRGRRHRTAAAQALGNHRDHLRGAGRHLWRRIRRAGLHARSAAAPVRAGAPGGRLAHRDVGGGVGRARSRSRAGRAWRMDPDRRRDGACEHPLGPLQLSVRVPRRGSFPRARAGIDRIVRGQAAGRRQPAVDLGDPARAGADRHVRAARGNHAGAQQPAGRRPPRPLDGDIRRRSRGRHRLGSEPADSAMRRSRMSAWR